MSLNREIWFFKRLPRLMSDRYFGMKIDEINGNKKISMNVT